MAYAPQDILRRTDNKLLAEYAKHHSLFPDLDIAKLKQTDVQPIYDAIQGLEDQQRERVERDLRNVAIVADKRRMQRLFAALQHDNIAFPEFDKKRDSHDKAIWVLLHHPDIFDGVLKYSFPFTEQYHWYKFPYPSGHPPTLDSVAYDRLTSGIKEFFRAYDGRGEHCRVEHNRFQDHDYLFAYPSAYPDRVPEWLENGKFEHVPHRLAFMVIFAFKKDSSAVDIYVREPLDIKRQLFALWAQAILGLDKVDTKPKRSHELTHFHTSDHRLEIPPESPVESLAVYKLRFAPRHNPKATYTIEADISENRQAVYNELEKKHLSIHYIKLIGLEATLQGKTANEKIVRRFEVSPGSCSLKHEDEAGILRQFLKDTRIDVTP